MTGSLTYALLKEIVWNNFTTLGRPSLSHAHAKMTSWINSSLLKEPVWDKHSAARSAKSLTNTNN
jgi:hypothetical protein